MICLAFKFPDSCQMLEIVSGTIYLFLSLNNALRWELFEDRNRRSSDYDRVSSLSLTLAVFDSVSLYFSLLLSYSLSVLISITPICSTITLRFQWQRFISIFRSFLLGVKCSAIGSCERSSRWLLFSLAEAASLDFSRQENSRRPHVDSASWPRANDAAVPRSTDCQIGAEKVRNCTLRREIACTSRMLRVLSHSMWNRWRGIGLIAHSSDHLESSLYYRYFLYLIHTESIKRAIRCRCFPS